MKISDDTLSAFLDQELPETEMQALRQAIKASPELAQRLADLGAADALAGLHAKAIDALPMPHAVTALLQPQAAGETNAADNVVPFRLWQQGRQFIVRHTALAASVLILLGFVAGSLPFSPATSPVPVVPGLGAAALTAALESTPSGTSASVPGGAELLPRFSFTDPQGRYCRQFQLQSAASISENLACRGQADWQVLATIQMSGVFPADEYQPASGMRLLDSILDEMMPGAALDRDSEAVLINEGW